MNSPQEIFLAVGRLLRRLWFLPKAITRAAAQRRHLAFLKECEVERLDRIRNPSKYLGS